MSNPVVIEAVPGTSYADLTREFDAPVAAVFRAHTDRTSFAEWIGPRSLTTTITQWDVRTGGGYAYEQRDTDGAVYAFRGVFHSVVENELIIQTFEYVGMPDEVALELMRFEELPDGRSRLSSRSVMSSREALESMVENGMEYGVREGYEKLDELLLRQGA